ncbi:uncharacterized protein C5L36_0B11120 [Pichia kudriavzevii]|uniref:Uncharacterized protein n=2 Tax=Pichia kudriavzevii TaxID=4909 RepID=A0A2U9R3G9_PICKU|nr:uncharacterized protein C5L36_0B11120 [Pichia kudriavzevii]AWU75877.1 hypothetical protein C5L36_0B11120 [Pichia kudriavzevii]
MRILSSKRRLLLYTILAISTFWIVPNRSDGETENLEIGNESEKLDVNNNDTPILEEINAHDEEIEIDGFIEKQMKLEFGSEIDEIVKLTDEEIREVMRKSKKEKEGSIPNSSNLQNYSDPIDKVQGTLIDNDRRIRMDEPPDEQPWSQYEIARRIPKYYKSNKGLINATIFTLCRNSELFSILDSIHQVETRFNTRYHYDWVFLNEEPFSEEFIELTSNLVSGRTRYGLIPGEHWSYPEHIDQEKARKIRESSYWRPILYGSSESYRHMCRFNSMFFYKHPIMRDYDYYWRVEPDVKFHCDILNDPFKFLKENGKKYGFTISMKELPNTIETLWHHTRKYFKSLPIDYFSPDYRRENLVKFISDDSGISYNYCHYWTNFEIADLSIFRNEIYEGYVQYLDKAGGFFYERWGDAPIHSIVFSLMLRKEEVHLFQDISYEHTVAQSCPLDKEIRKTAKCVCDPIDSEILTDDYCNVRFLEAADVEKPEDFDDYVSKIYGRIFERIELRQERKKIFKENIRRESLRRRKKAEELRGHQFSLKKSR